MPKLSKTTLGVATLGGAAGAAYINKKMKQEPNRGPWDPSADSQIQYDYIILGGNELQSRPQHIRHSAVQ